MIPGLVPCAAALLALIGAAAFAPAHAEVGFLRMSDGPVPIVGESDLKGYENWIEIDAAAWNITAETSWTKGGGASVGRPIPGALMWAQTLDSSTPSMYYYPLTGHAVPLVTLELVKEGRAGPATFMQLAMTDAFFTALALDGNTVSGSIVFKTVTQYVWPLLKDGTRGEPAAFAWDIPSGGVSPAGGLAALVEGYGPGNLSPSPVPEPGAWTFLLLGLGAIVVTIGRRRTHSMCRGGPSAQFPARMAR